MTKRKRAFEAIEFLEAARILRRNTPGADDSYAGRKLVFMLAKPESLVEARDEHDKIIPPADIRMLGVPDFRARVFVADDRTERPFTCLRVSSWHLGRWLKKNRLKLLGQG